MACFASKDSVQALEKRIEETPNPGFAQTREELVNARAVELRGGKGDFVCEHCGEVGEYQDNDAQFLDALWRDNTSQRQD